VVATFLDLPECGRADVAIRRPEIGTIEQGKELSSELKFLTFRDVDVFEVGSGVRAWKALVLNHLRTVCSHLPANCRARAGTSYPAGARREDSTDSQDQAVPGVKHGAPTLGGQIGFCTRSFSPATGLDAEPVMLNDETSSIDFECVYEVRNDHP